MKGSESGRLIVQVSDRVSVRGIASTYGCPAEVGPEVG